MCDQEGDHYSILKIYKAWVNSNYSDEYKKKIYKKKNC